MNQEVKAKWLTALRSGEYTQGQGALCQVLPGSTTQSFCCLGILTDLYIKENNLYWQYLNESKGIQYFELDLCTAVVPQRVQEWAGLPCANPSISVNAFPFDRNLATVNDSGTSFAEIADLIEERL